MHLLAHIDFSKVSMAHTKKDSLQATSLEVEREGNADMLRGKISACGLQTEQTERPLIREQQGWIIGTEVKKRILSRIKNFEASQTISAEQGDSRKSRSDSEWGLSNQGK